MTAKTVAADVSVYDKFVQLCARLLEYCNNLDIKLCYTAFLETLMACACSCFPTMDLDTYIDDVDSSTEQKKVNASTQYNTMQ